MMVSEGLYGVNAPLYVGENANQFDQTRTLQLGLVQPDAVTVTLGATGTSKM